MFFKYFSRKIEISRTFQDSYVYSRTFQACANPVHRRAAKILISLHKNAVTPEPLLISPEFSPISQVNLLSIKLELFSFSSYIPCILGAQKNCLNETVLLSTLNICFG